MFSNELKALLALLDDTDVLVSREVTERIVALGSAIIPNLEQRWEECSSAAVQSRIEELIHTIQFRSAANRLEHWVASGSANLVEGAACVAAYTYPSVTLESIETELDQLKAQIWSVLNPNLTPLDKIKIVNHFFFNVFRFNPTPADLFSPENHFINKVLENRRGGPVCLSIIYSVLAQKLGLPVHCVSLPRNFILVYHNRYTNLEGLPGKPSRALFYINPYSSGKVLAYRDIETYLSKVGAETKAEFFEPCTHRITIGQLLASLMVACQKIDQLGKVKDLQQLLNIVVPPGRS